MELESYNILNERVSSNWYNISRRLLIKKLIKKLKIKFENPLDIGCGVGQNSLLLKELSESKTVVGIDFVDEAIKFCKEMGINAYKGDLEKKETLPKDKFDFILLSDVLEHVNDEIAMKNVIEISNGYLFIVVPMYNFLWGDIDIASHHKKRYTESGILKLLKENNLKIVYKNYGNFFAFFPDLFLTFFQRLRNKERGSISTGPKILNKLFLLIAKLEIALMSFIKYPFGVEIVVIAKKSRERIV